MNSLLSINAKRNFESISFVPIHGIQLNESTHTVNINTSVKLKKSALEILKKNQNFLYEALGIPLSHEFFNNYIIYSYNSASFEDYLKKLQNVLWLIKDNAVDYTMLASIDNNENQFRISFNSTKASKSDGSYDNTYFSAAELHKTVNLIKILESRNIFINLNSLDIYSHSPHQIIYSYDKNLDYDKLNRLQISWRFTQLARTQTFLYSKIAFYVMALESLFSNVRYNVKNTLCDRVIKFFNLNYPITQSLTRETLEKGYTIRSTYLHGSSENISDLTELSYEIDNILRRVYLIIIDKYANFGDFTLDEYNHWINEIDQTNLS